MGAHDDMNRRHAAVAEKIKGWSKERLSEFKRRVNEHLNGPTSITVAQAMESAHAQMTAGFGRIYMGRRVR